MQKIAVIPGDGIGQEVITEARKVLDVALPDHQATEFDLGARGYHRTKEALPAEVQAQLAEHDAILLGAVGDPSVPPGVLERGLLLKLRFEFDQYVNLRPARLWPGVKSPLAGVKSGDIDFLVVREGTEGLYAGAGGIVQRGTSAEVATEESLNTRYGVERVIRYACHVAASRERKRLTLVHKTNVLVNAGSLWQRAFDEVTAEFPELTVDYQHVDAAAMFIVDRPESYDVIVTDNLFGDIITDIAASITGGIGLASSACINPDQTYPSMFEPVHGSAPDIAGQGVADPVATIISTAMLLEHLGKNEEADIVRNACANELANRDVAAQLRTAEIGDRVAGQVAAEL